MRFQVLRSWFNNGSRRIVGTWFPFARTRVTDSLPAVETSTRVSTRRQLLALCSYRESRGGAGDGAGERLAGLAVGYSAGDWGDYQRRVCLPALINCWASSLNPYARPA